MIRKLAIVLVIIGFSFSLMAQQSEMVKANDLYVQGNFQEAAKTYQALVDTGMVSGALFYNLGNAYYKSGRLAPAILNFERAKLYIPKDKDLQYNLEMAQRMVVDKIDIVDVFFLNRWLTSFKNSLNSDEWAITGIIALIIFFAGLSFYTFSGREGIKRLGFYLGAVTLVIGIVAFTNSFSAKRAITQRSGAVVFSPTVTVKGSPDPSGTELFILHEGTRVNVTDSLGEWNEIVLGDGNVGWLKKDAIKRI